MFIPLCLRGGLKLEIALILSQIPRFFAGNQHLVFEMAY